jgi:hypothetical protein
METSLHPKFYKDVKSAPNYTEKLIFMGIATTTLKSVCNGMNKPFVPSKMNPLPYILYTMYISHLYKLRMLFYTTRKRSNSGF